MRYWLSSTDYGSINSVKPLPILTLMGNAIINESAVIRRWVGYWVGNGVSLPLKIKTGRTGPKVRHAPPASMPCIAPEKCPALLGGRVISDAGAGHGEMPGRC